VLVNQQNIDPSQLSLAQRDQLAADLHAVHCKIFEPISAARFRRYVIAPAARQTWIVRFTDEAGQDIGYAASHAYIVEHSGVRIVVCRSEAGMLPQWRGGGLAASAVARQLIGLRLRFWHRRVYYLGAFVHPSAYRAFLKRTPTLRPSPDRPMSASEQQLVECLADQFELPRVEGRRATIRDVGRVTRDAASRTRIGHDAASRYFVAHNPGYGEGQGMLVLVLVPAGLVDFCWTLLSLADFVLREQSSRLRGTLGVARTG
jgi:hypothetical protein